MRGTKQSQKEWDGRALRARHDLFSKESTGKAGSFAVGARARVSAPIGGDPEMDMRCKMKDRP